MLLKYYCFVNILVFVAAHMNFRSQDMQNGPTSKNLDKNEHRKEQLYNEVVSNISKVNSIIEDLIVNYEKLKNLYKSDEKISDYSSDAEVDQVYKQKRAKGLNQEVKKTTRTKNPFDVATEMFFSEEKANNDDDESDNNTNENNSEETTTLEAPIKIEIGNEDKTKTEKEKIEKLNEEYLKTEKSDYDLQKTEDIHSIVSEKTTTYETTKKSTYSVEKENKYPNIGEMVIGNNYDVIVSATTVNQTTTQSVYSNVKKLSQKRVDKFLDFDSQEQITDIKKSTGKKKIILGKEKNNVSEDKDDFKKRDSEKEVPFQSNPENGSPIMNEKDVDTFTKPIPYEDDISDVSSPEQKENTSGIEDQENNNEAKNENKFQPDTEFIDNNGHQEQEDNINKVKQSRITLTKQAMTYPKLARLDEPGLVLLEQDGQPINSIKDFLTKDLFTGTKPNIFNENALLSNKKKIVIKNDDKRETNSLNAIKTKKQVPQVKLVSEDKNIKRVIEDVEANSAADGTVESGSYEDSASMESESGDPIDIINSNDEENGNSNESPLRILKETEKNPPIKKYPAQNHEIQLVSKPNDAHKSRFSISSRNNTDRLYRQRVKSFGTNAVRQKSSPVYVQKVIHLDEYPDPWNNKYQTPASSQTTHQQPRIFFRDQLPPSKKATTSTLLRAISDFYKTNKHLQHADEVLFRRLENTEQSNSLNDDDTIKKEQLQTRILRKAYGDACLKVVVRKCWKACKAASKDTCVKYNCKEPFKTAFKTNAKKTCINEFSENLYQRKGEGSSKTNFVDITRNGYLAAACLPMTEKKKPPLRSNASIEEFGPFIQLNILRDRFEKACQQASSEKCTKACSDAVTQSCDETNCQGHKKDYFIKQCKKDCKKSYRGVKHGKSKEKDSSSSSGSSEGSSKRCKGSKCKKHKKRKRCKGSKCKNKHKKSKESSSSSSGSSSSESESSDSTDFELSLAVNKTSEDKLLPDIKDNNVGKPKENTAIKEEKKASQKENEENRKETAKEDQDTEKEDQDAEKEDQDDEKEDQDTEKKDQDTEKEESIEIKAEKAKSKEVDVSKGLIRQRKLKKQKQKKKHKKGKKPKTNETKAEN